MQTTPRRRLTATLIACALCFAPMSSFAQDPDEEVASPILTSAYLSLYALPYTLAAIAGMAITAGGVVFTTTTWQKKNKEKTEGEQLAALLDGYMSEHPEAWRDTVALGGGLLIDDLSGVLALRPEERGAFGAALRQQRQPMLALLDAPPGMARGHQAVALLLSARGAVSAQ